ncbi:MAG TPA: hypothetical protein VIT67_07365 [Povalibacter sp.]
MSGQTEFKSFVLSRHRAALEQLLFFNRCQERVASGIADAVEMFGTPEIIRVGNDRLSVALAELQDTQTLFALEKDTGRPVGVALYTRADLEHISVLHVSIAAEYASGGMRSDEQLLLRLLREVRRSTRRMKGVRRLELYYGRGRSPATRWRPLAKAAM